MAGGIYLIQDGGRLVEMNEEGYESEYQGELYSTFATMEENGITRVPEGSTFSADQVYLSGFPNGPRGHTYRS